ncbi:MAG: response regulator [Magnetococcales bacterium]|nr:response regulator [Magnetococcales bacterium]
MEVKGKILIVDDVLTNIKVLVQLLKNDYELLVANNGPRALELATLERPDLVLLDVMMPHMDGYEVCRRLKGADDTRDIPVIFVSARDEGEDEAKGFELGAIDYVTKPFSKAVVQARVKNHMELKHHRDSMFSLMAELKRARDKAEASSRAKSDFLANMSHELRTPMNSVIGMTELVLETEDNPNHIKCLRTAISSAKGLLALLDDILDLSRIERGQLERVSSDFDLRQLLEEIVYSMNILAKAKNLELTLEMRGTWTHCHTGDPIHLRQIIMNLVGNAIKFTEKGHVTIIVTREAEERLQFAIQDTGIGIPLDRQRHIFDSFTQADTSMTRRYGGSGLGTTIAKELVEKMGGSIWVESEVGKGSTFYFVVPLPEVKGMCQCLNRLKPDPGVAMTTPSGSPLNILVADDVEINRTLLVTRFQRRGHKVTVALDGAHALELNDQDTFDVIFMDIQMPNMDGLAATRIIREREMAMASSRHVLIIAMTSHAPAMDRDHYREAGMDEIIERPIDFGALDRILAHWFPMSGGESTKATMGYGGNSRDRMADFPVLATVCVQEALNQWENPRVFYKSLMEFVDYHLQDGAVIRSAIAAGQIQTAVALAHALKGGAGSLHASNLSRAAGMLELELRQPNADLDPLLHELDEAMDALRMECAGLRDIWDESIQVSRWSKGPIAHHQVDRMKEMAYALDHGDMMTAESCLPDLTALLQGSFMAHDLDLLTVQIEEIDCMGARTTLSRIMRSLDFD